ncbi:MAG: hypothetical protein J5892_01455 [Bacilli bacterium]|nr:hypothetical protein [Bacilli bacterium]
MSNYFEAQDLNIAKINYSDIDTSNLEKIGEGYHSVVFKYEDIAIKVYHSTTYNSIGNINLELFEKLKEIQSKAFMELIDYSIILCKDEYCLSGNLHPKRRLIRAYSYKYLPKLPIKSIDMPIDYSLKSIYELKKFMLELNKKGIKIRDAHSENCIPTSDNIVIIDPDDYVLTNQDVTDNNISEIREYLFDLWLEEYGLNNHEQKNKLIDIFNDYDIEKDVERVSHEFKAKTPRKILDRCLNN